MLTSGVPDLPSDCTMDDIDKEMQRMCGIRSIRFEGKLGHVYYANDLPAIIAQEMSNLNCGPRLSEANQVECWLKEMDPDLLTPAHQVAGQEFFTLEPTVLQNGNVCMPSRWFVRNKKVFAKAWPMRVVDIEDYGHGWAVQTFSEIKISDSDLLLSYQQFRESHLSLGLMDPSLIVAEEESSKEFVIWEKTELGKGNRWRSKSNGKRVLAFPIWLYCDDTSGNVSKKWNKHNSFLFTAAGLPRHLANKESNIHFLSTSNTAPPLEMLDGIVLALCGDNPMQRKVDDEDNPSSTADDGNESDASLSSNSGRQSKKRNIESMKDMITRISDFMKRGKPRNREETCTELRSQFIEGARVGGATQYKQMKTESGVKDTYQDEFVAKIQAIATKKGLDPHQDTPVEILHVILLGVVKYYWRDAVARTKKDHDLLIGWLSSFNTWGLGISPLLGKTLVNYAGSLTGRDFRAIAQAAPFVLHGLLTDDQLKVWKALSALVTLV
ncbi:MAG: hypothetical protein NXY57DRAFT_979096 [Lentinula lateritia]|nr:MAG: hypothetical protein NXY57DRAFT_979096 [Lentinula lateritia]